jgi:hypothetical protein
MTISRGTQVRRQLGPIRLGHEGFLLKRLEASQGPPWAQATRNRRPVTEVGSNPYR